MQHHPNLSQQTKEHTPDKLHLHGQQLEVTFSSKYLGVTTTDDLSWTKRTENVAAQGNRTLGFLRRTFRVCTAKVRSATYITMERTPLKYASILEYASTVWDPVVQLLGRVQQDMPATTSETGQPVPNKSCSTIWNGTVLNNADSTTDFRRCTEEQLVG